MLIHWIWLSTRPGVSDRARAELLRHFQDAEDIYFAEESAYAVADGLSEDAVAALCDKNLTSAEVILEECNRKQIHILTYRDAAYPRRLQNIPADSRISPTLRWYSIIKAACPTSTASPASASSAPAGRPPTA